MRHFYKGPRPITVERYKNWLTEGLRSGRIGQVHSSGTSHDKAKRPYPWVEDEKPEPEDLPGPDGPISGVT